MKKIISPQPGYQTIALSSAADIVIGGAAAFVGKTFALLLDPLRHVHIKDFGGVIFRRTTPQIRNTGGLLDESIKLYPIAKGVCRDTSLDWFFPSGAKISFRHIEYEKDKFSWQGSQISFLAFDELTHFTESMFFYLLSRNRSMCGIKPYCRATCNPDPESWVAKLIEWWIDQETGFPIPERRGVIRYFIKYGSDYIWGDSYDEVYEKSKHFLQPMIDESGLDATNFIKSITFVSGSIYDNKEGLKADPSYPGNLLSQDEDTRRQLLEGNWKMSNSPDNIYNYQSFRGLFDNVLSIPKTGRFITADIAGQGSNKFIVLAWEGFTVIDILIMDKSNGPEVISGIKNMAIKHSIQNHYICYDNDGIGQLVDGWLPGMIPFNGGAAALEVKDPVSGQLVKENYFNLKTQCYYRSGLKVNAGQMKISEYVANLMYDNTQTVRQRFMQERKAIKKGNKDKDGKLKIIGKDEMKVMLNGESPDLMDAFMMRELFELKPRRINTDADY